MTAATARTTKMMLMKAAWKGHTEIALALIGAGAGLDLQDQYCKTALMRAANNGHTEIATVLIRAGAGLDLQEKVGKDVQLYSLS